MSTLIPPALFDAIARLSAQEQVAVIDFIRRFEDDPSHPGLQLHPLNRAKRSDLWSARISGDLRAILHKDGQDWAILYADHHDAAYRWAERRTVGRHPVTGALQIVEVVETVREVERVVEVDRPAPPLFGAQADDYLLSIGIPPAWLPVVRQVRDEDQLLTLCGHLPAGVGDRLIAIAAGELVTPPPPVEPEQSVTTAVDTRQGFYVAADRDELLAALEAPLERWIAFLHPSQRALVTATFSGPAKVSGSAGTGKTVVAMHRARHLARRGERVLLTSFVKTLCENLEHNLAKLCTADERARITVSTVHKQAFAIVRQVQPGVQIAKDVDVDGLLEGLRARLAPGYDTAFVKAEWQNLIRLQGIHRWEDYRKARRTGRGRPLSVTERKALWQVFGGVLAALEKAGTPDWAGLCQQAEQLVRSGTVSSPYTAVIVDELQDLKPAELRFLKALCAERPGNLMLCGDAGQRIYPGGFSLHQLGIDVRGRSTVLTINYRTTEQIRRVADRVVAALDDDMQGGEEARRAARSLLRGPEPVFAGYANAEAEDAAALDRLRSWMQEGMRGHEIAIFARTENRLDALGRVLDASGVRYHRLSADRAGASDAVHLATMHRAKGLEYKCVLVLDCAATALPNRTAMRSYSDPADREAAERREGQLLYVAMTRARDRLAVTWNGEPSTFVREVAGVTRQDAVRGWSGPAS